MSVESALQLAMEKDPTFTDVRRSQILVEDIVVGERVERIRRSLVQGIGIRLITRKGIGFSSTLGNSRKALRAAVLRAIRNSKRSGHRWKPEILGNMKPKQDKVESTYKINPFEVDTQEKKELLCSLNNFLIDAGKFKSLKSHFKAMKSMVHVVSSLGTDVWTKSIAVGFLISSTSKKSGVERKTQQGFSSWSGFELLRNVNFKDLATQSLGNDTEDHEVKKVKPGRYSVILTPVMAGLLVHEAIGHVCEGDNFARSPAVLNARLGENICSGDVTVYDGPINDGVFMPYDDEGNSKTKTYIVKNGVMIDLLTSMDDAFTLDKNPSGNGRAQDYSHPPISRQSNICLEPGELSPEEMIRETRSGLYLVSARGNGEITDSGNFTLNDCTGWIVKNGELGAKVRKIQIREPLGVALQKIRAVGKDAQSYVNIFGRCYKRGQRVIVGRRAPHVKFVDLRVVD